MLVAPFVWIGPFTNLAAARDSSCAELHREDLAALNESLDQLFVDRQVGAARRLSGLAETQLPCMLDLVATEDLARFAMRVAFAQSGDPEAERWAQLAQSLEPGFVWPAYVPSGHQVRELVTAGPTAAVTLEGKGLVPPPGGGVFLDGRFLTTPTAEPGLPHLLQVGDRLGAIETTWMDGTAFPAELLGPPLDVAPTLPPWFSADGTRVKVKQPKRAWTEPRLANLERAAGFAVAGGALFGSALAARGAYDERPTNGLFVATDGATIGATLSGATSLVFLGAALLGK